MFPWESLHIVGIQISGILHILLLLYMYIYIFFYFFPHVLVLHEGDRSATHRRALYIY